jgi:mevalonate kinase
VESGELSWLDGGRDFGLFEAVWNTSRPATASRCLAVSLDTAVFRDPGSGSKIGLGSSAALTAALATALHALGGDKADTVAHVAHRLFQGGAGSGVDIACSIEGGTVEYRMAGRQATPVEWPAGLYFSVLWSGISADTGGRLARFADQPGSPSRNELGEASASVAAEFERGQAAGVIAALGSGSSTRVIKRLRSVRRKQAWCTSPVEPGAAISASRWRRAGHRWHHSRKQRRAPVSCGSR